MSGKLGTNGQSYRPDHKIVTTKNLISGQQMNQKSNPSSPTSRGGKRVLSQQGEQEAMPKDRDGSPLVSWNDIDLDPSYTEFTLLSKNSDFLHLNSRFNRKNLQNVQKRNKSMIKRNNKEQFEIKLAKGYNACLLTGKRYTAM